MIHLPFAALSNAKQLYGNPCFLYHWISGKGICSFGKVLDPLVVLATIEENELLPFDLIQ